MWNNMSWNKQSEGGMAAKWIGLHYTDQEIEMALSSTQRDGRGEGWRGQSPLLENNPRKVKGRRMTRLMPASQAPDSPQRQMKMACRPFYGLCPGCSFSGSFASSSGQPPNTEVPHALGYPRAWTLAFSSVSLSLQRISISSLALSIIYNLLTLKVKSSINLSLKL